MRMCRGMKLHSGREKGEYSMAIRVASSGFPAMVASDAARRDDLVPFATRNELTRRKGQ